MILQHNIAGVNLKQIQAQLLHKLQTHDVTYIGEK